MKKITLSIILLLLLTALLPAQNSISPVNGGIKVKHSLIQPELAMTGKAAYVDTVLYLWMKTTGNATWQLNTTTPSISQYFNAPQSLQVKGANFYAKAATVPSVACTVQLFLAGADSMPTGSALATISVNVDSSAANGVLQHAIFTNPISVNAPYVIVVTNASANGVYIVTNSDVNNDGQGENLSRIKVGLNWARLLSYGYDVDWLIEPVVSYNLARVYFTKDKLCINNGDIVNFTNMHPAIYRDRMYDYYESVDSAKYQFLWNFGDLPVNVSAIDTSHQYATAGLYTITLADFFVGWYYYTNMQDTTATIDICSGIENDLTTEFAVFPNPATDRLTITNAVNGHAELYNMLGLMVRRTDLATNNETIDISSLPSGTYFIRIEKEGRTTTHKIEVRK